MSHQHGFTLLEILVVLVLIALTTTIITITFHYDYKHVVEREARRFSALVEQMCQESIIQGNVLAITQPGPGGYSFVVLTDSGWASTSDDELFVSRNLPDDMKIELTVHDSGAEKKQNFLKCTPDGVMSQFSALFAVEDIRFWVTSNNAQAIQIRQEGNEFPENE